jgi:hypothetical protein
MGKGERALRPLPLPLSLVLVPSHVMLTAVPPARARRSGHKRYSVDSHGHSHTAVSLLPAPDLQRGGGPNLHGMQEVGERARRLRA